VKEALKYDCRTQTVQRFSQQANKSIQNVAKFKYLGTVVMNANSQRSEE
jgi:hypothetical protein